MEDRPPLQPEVKESASERSPIHRLTDSQMVDIINCEGVRHYFQLDTVAWNENATQEVNEATGASYSLQTGTILDKDSNQFVLTRASDLDSEVMKIIDPRNQTTVIKVSLRDRAHDGTPSSSPPSFLRAEGTAEEDIPARSYLLGQVSWMHADPVLDDVGDKRAVELSVEASHPDFYLADMYGAQSTQEEEPDPVALARFVDRPFAALPFDSPQDSERLDKWYSMFWQVLAPGLDGDTIPLPGQASQKSFGGFLQHVVRTAEHYVHDLGYTHLSVIPTWEYVWKKFQQLGFTPDNPVSHQIAQDVFDRLGQITLTREGGQTIIDMDNNTALLSWLALLPFAIALNPDHEPQITASNENGDTFFTVFNALKSALILPDGQLLQYPLSPGKNLWYSLEVKP